jgi:hypothetical protein
MQTRSGQEYSLSSVSSSSTLSSRSQSSSPPVSPPSSPSTSRPVSLSYPSYNVNIDFDDASTAWKMNKKYIGNGCYKYVCVKIKKNGQSCKNERLHNCNYCRFHINCRNIEHSDVL